MLLGLNLSSASHVVWGNPEIRRFRDMSSTVNTHFAWGDLLPGVSSKLESTRQGSRGYKSIHILRVRDSLQQLWCEIVTLAWVCLRCEDLISLPM